MTAQDTLELKRFPVVVNSDCRAMSKIYPLKQAEVEKIIEAAGQFSFVNKIYIFGSSVTGRCHIDSDLDICIDADTRDGMDIYRLQQVIGEICDWNCDMVMYKNIGNRLKETIAKEGVIIYERTAS